MLPIMQHIVIAFLFVGLFLLVLSHFFQTWECEDHTTLGTLPYCGNWGVHPETIGDPDSTWGTRLTAWILFIECAVMAAKAPGKGAVKTFIQVAFGLDCLRWLADAILHSFLNEVGDAQDAFVHITYILAILIGCARVFAALVAAKDAFECDCMPKQNVHGAAIGLVGVIVIVLYFVYPDSRIEITSVFTHVAIFFVILVAVLARLEKWGVALALAYLVCALMHHLSYAGWSYPFHYSADFNSSGLWRAASMIYLAVLFGYFNGFVDNADEIKREDKLEAALGLEDELEEEIEG